MIAVDTNLLVYAHRAWAREHSRARPIVEALVTGQRQWGLPWPVAHEFVRVVTRAVEDPTPLPEAVGAIARLLGTPGCVTLGESRGHWGRVTDLALRGGTSGALFYDARIAAICLDHGVRELWSADRDFGRFPELRVVNPLEG